MSDPDPLKKAAANVGALGELAAMVPGFQGYMKAEIRRDADRIQREHLCSQLDEARGPLVAAQREWVDANRFANLELGEKVQNEVQRVTSRVKNADAGYSGFFAADQIGPAELEMLYEIDRNLLGYVEAIQAAARAVDPEADDGAARAALKAVLEAVKDLDDAFSKRKDMITGVA